jgi:hypothetical protein
MPDPKKQAHELIDRLRPTQVSAVVGLLEAMLEPVSHPTASIDNEPLSPEGETALDEAREWSKHNRSIPHQQVLAELGVTQEEIERFQEPK